MQKRAKAVGVAAAGMIAGYALVALAIGSAGPVQGQSAPVPPTSEAALKASFARPAYVPHPANNPPTPAKIALGKRIFEDPQLSANGRVSCASCHDARLSFTDGEALGKGVSGKRLARHSPTLWNAAFSPLLFWDGRATSLEDQAKFPVSHPDEMGASLEAGAERLATDESYRTAFATVFPDAKGAITAELMARAIAAYERTLVSPPTFFDAWIAGDAKALGASEQRGFAIFTGKGKCSVCHSGFALTDHSFYDIGLPTDDEGRGKILDLAGTRHAFKTPTLRELAWTAPYMHDGSLATLEDVVRFYEAGGVDRPSKAGDLPKALQLTDTERQDLIAFLEALSSDAPPEASQEPWVLSSAGQPPAAPAAAVNVVHQAGKQFTPSRVAIAASDLLTVLNDDTRTHNVRIFDPRFDYNSGAQEPRQTLQVKLPGPGTYEAFCGIHPTMRLTIEVR
jgi:cytochrome c peroxidase